MKNIEKLDDSLIFQNKFYDSATGQLLSPVELQNYTIVQVADSYYLKSFSIDDHLQYCDLEITFSLTNNLICLTDGISDRVNKHEIYLSFAGDTHALNSRRSCRFQTLAINFKDGPCVTMLAQIKRKFQSCRTAAAPELSSRMSDIIAEFLTPDMDFSHNNLDSLITSVLVMLTRFGADTRNRTALTTEQSLPDIINYLDSHYLDICSLDELSDHFGYSYSHICKAFKKLYRMTPGDYLNTRRMEHAAMCLCKGIRIAQIAETLGYSTPYNFSRAFKKHHGVAPSKYSAESKAEITGDP